MSDRAPNAPSRTPVSERRCRATRRAILAGPALAVGGLSGCLGRAFRDEPPAVTVAVQSTERVDDPEHDASVEVTDETAQIEGQFAASVACVDLDVSVFTSSPDEGLAVVEIAAGEIGEDCEGPAAVNYEGEIEFGFAIRELTLNHRLDGGNDRVTVGRYERDD